MRVRVPVVSSPPLPAADTAALLSAEELARRDGYLHPADRDRFATGRALLRRMVARQTGQAPEAVEVVQRCPHCGGAHGRPLLPGTGLVASVAHGGGWVLVTVAPVPLGVDVEPVEAVRFGGFDATALTARERIEAGPDDVRRADAWVRKEALLKLHGIGLERDPAAVHVGVSGALVPDPLAPGHTVALVELPLDAAHRAWLAVAGDEPPEVQRLSAAEVGAAPAR